MVDEKEFRKTLEKMLKLSATRIPSDVKKSINKAKKNEKSSIAKNQLNNILKNIEIAEKNERPLCQDTGVPIFFIEIPKERRIDFDIEKTIEMALTEATRKVPLRPNIVDPITRENSGNNTGEKHPLIHLSQIKSNEMEVNLLLKGAGSENWSRLFMLKPSSSKDDIKKRVLKTVQDASGQVCPPSVLGIGIGGTADTANILAKKALLRPLNEKKNRELSRMERELKNAANDLDIGPMGLGGKNTVLDVKIEKAGCHTATLPVALNFNCWAVRKSRAREKNGKLEIEVPK
ncbi:MAG: fumarate hydratase [Candidatus Hadarchaeota archaeon]